MTDTDIGVKSKLHARKPYPTREELGARLQEKIEPYNGTSCWIWKASIGGHGYGQLSVCGRPRLAHRISYEVYIGEIPKGMQLDHLCRVRSCVNPMHLEPVTPAVNSQRGMGGKTRIKLMRERTHCNKGHLLTDDNVKWPERDRKWCKICYEAGVKLRNDRRIRTPVELRKPNVGDIGRSKTHCPQGHAYEGENLVISKRGGRVCRACIRKQSRERQRKIRGYSGRPWTRRSEQQNDAVDNSK